jgi:hypothetical protein
MQEAETSSTKLLCPNGHGLQPAKRTGAEWLLSCTCTRGNALPPRTKTGIQTPPILQKAAAPKPAILDYPTLEMNTQSAFAPEVEYEERAPQEEETGSEYVRPTAREAGEYAAFIGKTN